MCGNVRPVCTVSDVCTSEETMLVRTEAGVIILAEPLCFQL